MLSYYGSEARRGYRQRNRVEPQTFSDKHIYSRLAHTPATEKMWNGFRATFLFRDYNIHTVIGNWGKIYLVFWARPEDRKSPLLRTSGYQKRGGKFIGRFSWTIVGPPASPNDCSSLTDDFITACQA